MSATTDGASSGSACVPIPEGPARQTIVGDMKRAQLLTKLVDGPPGWRSEGATEVGILPDNSRILLAAANGWVTWDLSSGSTVVKLHEKHTDASPLAVSADATRILTTQIKAQGGTEDNPSLQQITDDHKDVFTGLKGGVVSVWDAMIGERVLAPTRKHDELVTYAAFSPDGTRVVSAALDKTIRVWDAATGEDIAGPLRGHNPFVTAVSFSYDGTRIISCGSFDRTIRIWDAATGEQTRVLEGHAGVILDGVASPDDSRIVSGAINGSLRVWDVGSGECLMMMKNSDKYQLAVTKVRVPSDGKWVISGSYEGQVRVWDADTGKLVGVSGTLEWEPEEEFKEWMKSNSSGKASVQDLAISSDGKLIVSVIQGQVQVYQWGS